MNTSEMATKFKSNEFYLSLSIMFTTLAVVATVWRQAGEGSFDEDDS